jgi:uncharacterized membrane protein
MLVNKQTETEKSNPKSNIAQRLAGAVVGIIEAVLAFRLVFKLLGANPANGFVHGVYAVTQFFVGAFAGIFSQTAMGAPNAIAVFEPATVIGMAVVALIGWFVLKVLTPRDGARSQKTEYTEFDGQQK